MKKTNKMISLFLSLIMLIGVMAGVSIPSYADNNSYISEDYEYTFYEYGNNNEITITKYLGNNEKIVIPSTINGYTVAKIGSYAFKNCKNITSITLSETIESFYFNAFEGCTNLTQLAVDKNNKVFDSRNNCNAIINTKRNELVFGIKTSLIPDTIVKIGENSFSYLNSPENIVIPNSVKYIGGCAFYNCDNLKKLLIPKSIEFIGMDAFSNCSNLQSIEIEEGATDIGQFKNCKNLIDIVVPKSVITITADAFVGCVNLKSITILNKELKYSEGDDNYWGMYDGLPKNTVIYGYKNSTAQRYAEEYDRNFVAIDEAVIPQGTNATYKHGSKTGASVHCAYPLDTFISVAVDDNIVDRRNYTLAEGSTILTFSPSYLDTLSIGKHTITMEYTIGTISTQLTVEDADTNTSEEQTTQKTEQTTQKTEQTTQKTEQTTALIPIKNKNSKSPDTGSHSMLTATACASFLSAGIMLIAVRRKKA